MIITEKIEKNKQKVVLNNRRICVGSNYKRAYVFISDILYVEANENYSWLHLKQGKKLLSYKCLKHYEDTLVRNGFFRSHRSYLINLSYVKAYDKKYRLIYLKNGMVLSVSFRRNHDFSKRIQEYHQPQTN
jgi:DNA-binding LytR/AlgR family response regulator